MSGFVGKSQTNYKYSLQPAYKIKTFPHVEGISEKHQTEIVTELFFIKKQAINPFHPVCKTVFFTLLQILRIIFQFLRPEHDGHMKFTSCSTQRTIRATL